VSKVAHSPSLASCRGLPLSFFVFNFFFLSLYIYILFIKSDMCHHFIGIDMSLNGIR
jgi:hypothetical protein